MAKVLIIDDDPISHAVLEEALIAVGFTDVASAMDGRDAARLYFEAAGDYSLVVCDLMMPEFDGIEFINFLSTFQTACPLIVCSSADSASVNSAVILSEKLGVELLGTLRKPVVVSELTHLVKDIPFGSRDFQMAYKAAV